MNDFIITSESDPDITRPGQVAPDSYRAYVVSLCLRSGRPPPPKFGAPKGSTYAYVNHGRWVCDCTLCNSAMIASKRDRVFWCMDCRMAQNDGLPMEAIFPDGAKLKAIEAILLKRANAKNRNWYWWENIEGLVLENIQYGAEVEIR